MITPLNKHGDLTSIKLVLARRKALVIFERIAIWKSTHHQEQATSHFCAGFCGDVKLSSEQHTGPSACVRLHDDTSRLTKECSLYFIETIKKQPAWQSWLHPHRVGLAVNQSASRRHVILWTVSRRTAFAAENHPAKIHSHRKRGWRSSSWTPPTWAACHKS